MFTGIVEEVGTIDTISRGANSAVLIIRAEKVLAGTKVGDSITVSASRSQGSCHMLLQRMSCTRR